MLGWASNINLLGHERLGPPVQTQGPPRPRRRPAPTVAAAIREFTERGVHFGLARAAGAFDGGGNGAVPCVSDSGPPPV